MSESKTVSDLAKEVTTYVAQLQAENDKLRMKTASLEAALEGMHLIREQDKAENDKLRQMVARMWPMATGTKRCTFADRLKLRAEIDALGIEVPDE